MNKNIKNKKILNIALTFIIIFVGLYIIFPVFMVNFINIIASQSSSSSSKDKNNAKLFKILSTNENKDIADNIIQFGKKHGISIYFDYAEDLEAVSLLNSSNVSYDAVWLSNSLWSYQVNKVHLKNSKSISINPIVMGIKKSKAVELGFVGQDVKNKDLVKAIKEGKLKYVMSSPIKTNSGASSFLGFLNSLAGSPELLSIDMLDSNDLKSNMVSLLSGVERTSGTDTFLEDMFLASDNYHAVIAAETSLILINKKLEKQGREPLYLIYPTDGVSICDSPFIYVDRGQEKVKQFELIQKYLLSKEMQKKLENTGRRTWYGGVNQNANKEVFKQSWGIDTNKYLIPIKYPSKKVIKKAFDLYINEFRKPTHTIFLLDYSGSMHGEGNKQLIEAMDYILDYQKASIDYIQFIPKDKITIIPFTNLVNEVWETNNGLDVNNLLISIKKKIPSGGTDIYMPIIKALDILDQESNEYAKVIILMTDGRSNTNEELFLQLLREKYGQNNNIVIPVYSIMFGNAYESQLEEIAKLSNAKVFDGRYNLLKAFKEVRNFN